MRKRHAVSKPADQPRDDRSEDEGGAVFGVIAEAFHAEMAHQQVRHRECDDKHQRLAGKLAPHALPEYDQKRQVAQQRQIAQINVE